jgi:hypothetical protein
MLYGITPGPSEWTSEELQRFMIDLVNDLIWLYEHGVLVKTPAHPDGKI